MKIKKIALIILTALLILCASGYMGQPITAVGIQAKTVVTGEMLLKNQKNLIAHAGGSINGYTHTNSLEALNQAVKDGFKLIELDFYKTKEATGGQYVLLHSEAYGSVFFGNAAQNGVTLAEFQSRSRYPNLTLMTAAQLDEWLGNHQAIRIIGDKLSAPEYILLGDTYANLQRALIPQVNTLAQYNSLKAYGYPELIFTLYSTPYTSDPTTIPALSKQVKLFGLTMPYETVGKLTVDEIKAIQQDNPIYAHTINDLFQVNQLRSLGINGYYTDYFAPKTFYLP